MSIKQIVKYGSFTDDDLNIIKNLSEESMEVDDEFFNEIKKWKDQLPEVKKLFYPDFPISIQSKLKQNLNKIWVHNFPWSTPEQLLNIKTHQLALIITI